MGYVVTTAAGNVAFEGAVFSPEALDFIEGELGGLAAISASHPPSY